MEVDFNESLMHQFHRASQLSELYFNGVASQNVTPRQFVILATVATREGASQTKIAEMTGIDRSTLADTINRLIQKGLITKHRMKNDARTYSVSITEIGRETLKHAAENAKKVDEKLLMKLTPDDRSALRRSLTTLLS